MTNQPCLRQRWRGSRNVRTGSLVLTLTGMLVGGIVQAQDGKAVLQKMVKAYQTLDSYDGSATVDVKVIGNQGAYKGKNLQSQSLYAILKFKKPNRLMLEMKAPSGSRSVFCDGKDFYVYDTLNNQYTRDPAPANTRELGLMLLRRAGIVAALDPLFFLTETTLPRELSSLKMAGTQKVNGHDTIKVTGVTQVAKLVRTLPDGRKVTLPAASRSWTWWIDKQTYLLHRVEGRDANFKVGIPLRQGKKVVLQPITATNISRHNVASATPNGASDEKVFVFQKPAKATEKKALGELLKGGQ